MKESTILDRRRISPWKLFLAQTKVHPRAVLETLFPVQETIFLVKSFSDVGKYHYSVTCSATRYVLCVFQVPF